MDATLRWRFVAFVSLATSSSLGSAVVKDVGERVWNFIGTSSVCGGILVWKRCCEVSSYVANDDGNKDDDVERSIAAELAKIDRDVPRTFSSFPLEKDRGNDVRTRRVECLLRRVLYALARIMRIHGKEVEKCRGRFNYCQGMNYVVGLTIYTLCDHGFWTNTQIEEIAFWLAMRMYEIEGTTSKRRTAGDSRPVIFGDAWVRKLITHPESTLSSFAAAMQLRLPNLCRHFEAKLDASPILFAPAMLSSLFLGFRNFDVRLSLATIDLLVANVRDAPLRVSLAALTFLEKDLLHTEATEDLLELLKPTPRVESSDGNADVANIVYEALRMDCSSFEAILPSNRRKASAKSEADIQAWVVLGGVE
eukprot:g877.t1